jgi:prepilin-type N-terminal cleavage/methylation domain-containing protein
MTSAVRTSDLRRGFTLLEIVIVLALAAVIVGGALGYMVYSSDERSLRDSAGKVEVFAKRARTIAMLQQTPYALEFRAGEVKLLPFSEAGQDNDRKQILDNVNVTDNDVGTTEKKREPVYDQLAFPDNMTVSIRHWNTAGFIQLDRKDSLQIWRFDPDGLCEPVSMRYSVPKGWIEDTFHPLTATVRDQQSELH